MYLYFRQLRQPSVLRLNSQANYYDLIYICFSNNPGIINSNVSFCLKTAFHLSNIGGLARKRLCVKESFNIHFIRRISFISLEWSVADYGWCVSLVLNRRMSCMFRKGFWGSEVNRLLLQQKPYDLLIVTSALQEQARREERTDAHCACCFHGHLRACH